MKTDALPIEITRGQDRDETFTVVDVDNAPVDISGCDLWLTVRDKPTGTVRLRKTLVAGVSNGITILTPQSGATKGQFKVRFNFGDTADVTIFPLKKTTNSYDTWIREVTSTGDRQPLQSPTVFTLLEPDTTDFSP